ncbi:MAG: hypothetical protein KF812_08015 [Fimbriimonadaceae bacterium]|nr:hypothetical protein [Fimbriimonadaceae bacterium]
MRGATALILVAAAGTILAEVDRDTMRVELNGLPGMPSIIAGRFEVETARCLTQRIERLTAELSAMGPPEDSATFSRFVELSEKLAASHDANSDPAAAATVIAKAVEAVSSYPDQSERELVASARRRLLMQQGRYLTHLGVSDGNQNTLEQAQESFRRAFEIGPPEPLGKEEVEAQLADWMLEDSSNLAAFLDGLSAADLVKFRNGMTGMMVTGEGWDNPDYLEILRMAIVRERTNSNLGPTSVSYALRRRIAELVMDKGETPIFGFPVTDAVLDNGAEMDEAQRVLASRAYEELSASGAEYRRRYTEWLEKGIVAGRHPDTDPKFWEGFQEAPLPRPEALDGKEPFEEREVQSALVGGGIGAFIAGMVVVYRRRKLAHQSVESKP